MPDGGPVAETIPCCQHCPTPEQYAQHIRTGHDTPCIYCQREVADQPATAASDDGGMEPDVETLQAEYAEIEAEQERLLRRKLEIADLLAPLGLHEHAHGAGLYSDPYRDHAHPFTDPEHTHETRSADDVPWPEVDY